jgi:hypothetical protein
MSICINIYTYIHTYTHTHTHTYIHTYLHTYIHTYIHLSLSVPALTFLPAFPSLSCYMHIFVFATSLPLSYHAHARARAHTQHARTHSDSHTRADIKNAHGPSLRRSGRPPRRDRCARGCVDPSLCVCVCLCVCLFAPHVRLGERRRAQRLGSGGALLRAQLHTTENGFRNTPKRPTASIDSSTVYNSL